MDPMPSPVPAPQWFTPVMGTAVVASACVAVPVGATALTVVADAAWAAAVVLLVVALGNAARVYAAEPSALRRHLDSPTVAPFFGAVAMGMLAVGGATLAVGPAWIGHQAAVAADATLWCVGTVVGLLVAVVVPARQFTTHRVTVAGASPAWLLPLVSPMVSAATGAMLIDHVSSAASRQALALACLAMIGSAGIAAALATASLWWRLAHHQQRDAATLPSLWIVLGPLGQCVTALSMLALHGSGAVPGLEGALAPAAVVMGVPLMGFAMTWLALALTVTVRVARRNLPFSMGWWSFTFPVGTCVTGAAGLAALTTSSWLGALSAALLVALMAGWCASAWGTVRAAAARRRGVSSPVTTPYAAVNASVM